MATRRQKVLDRLAQLDAEARAGGGADRMAKQHKSGKLTARERIDLLMDEGISSIWAAIAPEQRGPGVHILTGPIAVEGADACAVLNRLTTVTSYAA